MTCARRKWRTRLTLISGMLFATPVLGGFLVEAGGKWRMAAIDPPDDHNAVTYYGTGGDLGLGYSLGQIMDIAGYGSYVPLSLHNTESGREDVEHFEYGGQIKFRGFESIFLGARAGAAHIKMQRRHRTDEFSGAWEGPGGAFVFGAFAPNQKNTFWQLHLEWGRFQLKRIQIDKLTPRSEPKLFDHFSVCFAYVFNSKDLSFKNVFLGDFLKSLTR